jgi:hypothetical protein
VNCRFLKAQAGESRFVAATRCVLLLALVFGMSLFAIHAEAKRPSEDSRPTEGPCDVDYMTSLKSRAWLQAQQEITQNQNLIFKPDSVLEYTCFKDFMDVLAKTANDGEIEIPQQLFSESERWGTILGDTSLDNAMQNLTREAIGHWVTVNFGWSSATPEKLYYFLGGRSNPEAPTNGQGLFLEYDPPDVIPRDYTCGKMNDVWLEAKCMDFIDVPEEDGFFTFEEYRDDKDKRFLPKDDPFRCAKPLIRDEGQDRNRWEVNMEDAYDDTFTDDKDTTPWEEDFVVTFLDNMNPDNCGKRKEGKLISPPIETGLLVKRDAAPREYYEKVCVIPGCHYFPTGLHSGQCKPSQN